jgi:hypothetical protein
MLALVGVLLGTTGSQAATAQGCQVLGPTLGSCSFKTKTGSVFVVGAGRAWQVSWSWGP